MSDADLIFSQPLLANPADLVFGEQAAAPTFDVVVTGGFAAPTLAASAAYNADVARPVVGQAGARHQQAVAVRPVVRARAPGLAQAQASQAPRHGAAQPLRDWRPLRLRGVLLASRAEARPRHTTADPRRASVASAHQVLLRGVRPAITARHQQAAPLRAAAAARSQDFLRDARPSITSRSQKAMPLCLSRASQHQVAAARLLVQIARSQVAMRPPPGVSVAPPPPLREPCYRPSGVLVFADAIGTPALVFRCGEHSSPSAVFVPIRSIYMVTNNFSMTLLDGTPVPAIAASINLDADSWAWGFTATAPATALTLVQPTTSGPVELLVNVNGTVIRLVVEQISRERSFGQASVRISGRGRNAFLDAPYAPVRTFSNSSNRTAQQLMADVLTINGVPLGWAVDWGLEDWAIPAGVFSHQGSHITALTAIAAAGGGYLQPHPSAQLLRVKRRYPTAPWAWADAAPDLLLPAAVVTRESLTWQEKPAYNRVYVSGQVQGKGVLGRVTRAGTAGDLAAPMVVDPLITDAVAARQRGLRVLADTGRQIQVGLRLPVLAETGIVQPGTFLEYQDGPTARRGLVRSVNVEVGSPDTWQTLGVEVHA